VEHALFSEVDQTVYAVLTDAAEDRALLAHPYTSRSRAGTEELLARLQTQPETLRFVAGHVRAGAGGLRIAPISLVFQNGDTRTMVQPWVDRRSATAPTASLPAFSANDGAAETDPVAEFPVQLLEALGEQWLLGLERDDSHIHRAWTDLRDRGSGLGFHRLLLPLDELLADIETQRHSVQWQAGPARQVLLTLSLLTVLAVSTSPGSVPDTAHK
jgi:hypothetical protein